MWIRCLKQTIEKEYVQNFEVIRPIFAFAIGIECVNNGEYASVMCTNCITLDSDKK